jgi:hypothetical protein
MSVGAWTPDRILRYADEWVWVPEGAQEVRTEEYHLVAYPESMSIPTQVAWCRSARSSPELVAEVLEHVRRWGRTQVSFWVSERTTPADLEEYLQAQDAEYVEAVDVLALPLTGQEVDVGDLGDRVTVRVVDDERLVRLAVRVSDEVWGATTPEREVRRQVEELASRAGADSEWRVLAFVGDQPATVAGLRVDAEAGVARLWGGATRPALRGLGGYRATLLERLRLARSVGATLAMVKGVADTSAPILRAAGFTEYGSSRRYLLPVGRA